MVQIEMKNVPNTLKKSSFFNFLELNGFPMIIIISISCIVFILSTIPLIKGQKKYVQNNWLKYRANPLVMPFGDFLAPNPTGKSKRITGVQNFNKILFTNTQGYAKIFTQPLLFMVKGIHSNLNIFKTALNDIRKMGYKIRVFFLQITKNIMGRLQNAAATLLYFFAKLKAIFEKFYAVFVGIVYMMYSAYMTFQSMWNGPIGGVARFLCFDKNVEINLVNNTKKKINTIKIGDKLLDGGIVLGVLSTNSKGIDMYDYNGIKVSGDHLVKENGFWIRVQQSKKAKKIIYPESELFCLITEKNIININDIIFADYIETTDSFIQSIINDDTIKNLNKGFLSENKSNFNKTTYELGFSGNTLIEMKNGNYKEIRDLKIGDISSTGKIIGIIKQKSNNSINYNNSILSPNNILLSEKGWIQIGEINQQYIKSSTDNILYHLVTETGFIKLGNNNIFTDFTETLCVNTNQNIDNKITNYLNKKIFFERIIIYKIIHDKIKILNNNIITNKNINLY